MDYLFYSVIGKHAGESIEEIMDRKTKEIQVCGFSLWGAKIDKKSVEQVWRLNENDEVFVLCKISKNAKDPVNDNEIFSAKKMIGKDGEMTIPDEINITFAEGKNYQAYVVESYKVLNENMVFDFGPYETLTKNNITKSFGERFRCKQFQNTFGKLNSSIQEKCEKEINIIMKLKYPFVVNLS